MFNKPTSLNILDIGQNIVPGIQWTIIFFFKCLQEAVFMGYFMAFNNWKFQWCRTCIPFGYLGFVHVPTFPFLRMFNLRMSNQQLYFIAKNHIQGHWDLKQKQSHFSLRMHITRNLRSLSLFVQYSRMRQMVPQFWWHWHCMISTMILDVETKVIQFRTPLHRGTKSNSKKGEAATPKHDQMSQQHSAWHSKRLNWNQTERT